MPERLPPCWSSLTDEASNGLRGGLQVRRVPEALACPGLAQGPVQVRHHPQELGREWRRLRPFALGHALGDQPADRYLEPVVDVPVPDDLLAAVHAVEHQATFIRCTGAVG